MNLLKITFGLTILLSFLSCKNEIAENNSNAAFVKLNLIENEFDDYWYQNKAELSSYKLEQARYGEIHQGEAVLVFVTEDFSASKLVKLDNPSASPKDAVKVLKLNATRNFNTGIYPYSMMASVFTPIDFKKHPNTLKFTTSSQEWCGHTFMQANLEKNYYKVALNSYFESEGDKNFKADKIMLEDEIWTRIRIAPKSLPQGNITLLPGSFYTRLRHSEFKPQKAKAVLKEDSENDGFMVYNLQYTDLDRTLKITFQKNFPFQIESWEESYMSGWGKSAKKLTTKAVRNKTMLLDYWNKHNNEDLGLRKELGLEK
jgi:predicted RNA-binding protein